VNPDQLVARSRPLCLASLSCRLSQWWNPLRGMPLGSLPDLLVARAAVHWSSLSRLEGYLGILAAGGANGRVHLPWPMAIAASPPISSPSFSAAGTTPGLIGEALVGEELLLTGGKIKGAPTAYALKCLVLKTHR
jgi:hypothetical protein